MAPEDEARQASDRFYAALNRLLNGDPEPMTALWSHGPDVTTMHPIGGRELGWQQVGAVWEQVSKIVRGKVTVSDLVVCAIGDLAYTVGTEHVEAAIGGRALRFDIRATNAYRRQNGAWKMVHHHADVTPALQEAVGRLQA